MIVFHYVNLVAEHKATGKTVSFKFTAVSNESETKKPIDMVTEEFDLSGLDLENAKWDIKNNPSNKSFVVVHNL